MAEVIRMDENTYRMEDGFVRFFLLIGEEKAAMIDSGVNCPDAAGLARTLTDKPLLLVNTHGDGDHTSGTASFPEIRIHRDDYVGCGLADKYPNTALVELTDGETIDLGGRTLEIIHIPGHTEGSVAILDVERRALYAGDSVQKGHIFMFGKHRDPERFEGSLDKLIARQGEFDRIYASHDEACLPGDYTEKVRDAWREVRSGAVPYETIDRFGNAVRSYTTPACGFFLG